jgi:hypothetical protein
MFILHSLTGATDLSEIFDATIFKVKQSHSPFYTRSVQRNYCVLFGVQLFFILRGRFQDFRLTHTQIPFKLQDQAEHWNGG